MRLISPAALRSIDHLFCAAVRANIGVQAADEVEVLPQSTSPAKGEQPRTLVMLTCAALRFKLVAVFQIVDEALARAYFGGGDATADHMEMLSERGNLCCGALNRELQPYVPHLGLSTPSTLVGMASKVQATLRGEHASYFAIRVNGDHVLDVALCMRGQATVDFAADTSVAPAETGELELL